MRRIAVWVGLALVMVAPAAGAHDQPFSHARLDLASQRMQLEIQLHPVDAAALIGMDSPDSVTGEVPVYRHARALGKALAPRIVCTDGHQPIALVWEQARWDPGRRRVVAWRGTGKKRPCRQFRGSGHPKLPTNRGARPAARIDADL